jgi:hypothetical protein
VIPKKVAIALPRCSTGKAATTIASAEHDRRARALDHPEHDHPGLARVAGRRGAAERRGPGERDHADHDHAAVPGDVREAPAECEQSRQREQIGVHDPLRAGGRQVQVLLELRHGERDDRLVDEGHRDGEDHRRENQPASVPVAHRLRTVPVAPSGPRG